MARTQLARALSADRASGRRDSYLLMPICFDAFRQTIRQQGKESQLFDATMQSAKTPRAVHLIGATFLEEAENSMTGGRQRGWPWFVSRCCR